MSTMSGSGTPLDVPHFAEELRSAGLQLFDHFSEAALVSSMATFAALLAHPFVYLCSIHHLMSLRVLRKDYLAANDLMRFAQHRCKLTLTSSLYRT